MIADMAEPVSNVSILIGRLRDGEAEARDELLRSGA